jgi:uncharacterized protein YjbI with pentapeptide repeats
MLVCAMLTEVDLRDASLRDADLAGAVFSGAILTGADLSQAHLSSTVFARCGDLDRAVGLDTLTYLNPSCLDMATLRRCLPGLTAEFLDGGGLERREIEALSAAYAR